MLISIVNHTKGKLSDEQVLEGIRAVNRQIAHDFQPYWDFGGELRLEGTVDDKPDDEKLPELRGDAIIYSAINSNVRAAPEGARRPCSNDRFSRSGRRGA